MFSFQRPLSLLAVCSFSIFLVACGGGGGGGSKSKSSTSVIADTTPDNFTLTLPSDIDIDPNQATAGSSVTFDTITITGISAPTRVSITGGEFAIDNGEFGTEVKYVSNGQSIKVRVTSPIKANQTETATLTVGGVTSNFTITTEGDTTPPEVAVAFPPPASMTEGDTLYLRGTVKDVHGTLADGSVTVNGVAADLVLNEEGDEGTWSLTLPLVTGENLLTITATDTAGNINDAEAVSSRRVTSIAEESFPDDAVPFAGPIGVGLHEIEGKPVALVTDRPSNAILAIDLLTGKRSIFSSNDTQADHPLAYPWNIHVGENGKIYVFDWATVNPRIYELDDTGARTLFIGNSVDEKIIEQPFGMFLKQTDEGTFLYLAEKGTLSRINVETKEKTIISDSRNGIPDLIDPFSGALDMTFSKKTEQLIVITFYDKLHYVHPQTGARKKIENTDSLTVTNGMLLNDGKSFVAVDYLDKSISILDLDSGNIRQIAGSGLSSTNLLSEPRYIDVSPKDGYLLVTDRVLKSLVALDLESYQQVIVSKSGE